MSEKENLIYHYCSLNTFLTIIKNKTLRLSNILKSNDESEITYIINQSDNIIYDFLQHKTPEISDFNEYLCKEKIKNSIKNNIDYVKSQALFCHALCFSKKGDLLSQWRAYADDGNGVSIGFDKTILKGYINKCKYLKLENVKYQDAVSEAVKKDITNILQKVCENKYYRNSSPMQLIDQMCKEFVIRWFLNKAITYKNPGFNEEKEVRLHTCIPIKKFGVLTDKHISIIDDLKTQIKPLTIKYDFRANGNRIVSYFDIYFDKKDSKNGLWIPPQLIKKIIIGPKLDISPHEISHIMQMNQISISEDNIIKSKTSYR